MAEATTETAPEPTDIVGDAPVADTDIDALLAEFEAGTTQPQTTEQISESAAERDRAFAANLNAITEGYGLDAKREQLQAEAQALQQEYDRKDGLSALAEIRGNLPPEMFDDRNGLGLGAGP